VTARYYSSSALPTVLAANLGASGNPSVTALPGTWPTSYPFCCLIDWGDSAEEAILVTSAPTGTGPYSLPCTRGIDGTTAQAHSAGAQVAHGTTGYEPTLIQENAAAIAALEAGVGGGSVTLAGDLGNTNSDPQVLSTHLTAPLPENQGGTGSGTQNWQGLLTPVTQTGTYTATAGQLVKANIASASWTLTLPSAPAANTVVGAKVIANATGNANTLTVQCQGSDVFEQSGGATSTTLSLLSQAAAWQYNSGYWTRLSNDLPLGQLDGRYARVFSPIAFGAAGNGTTNDTTALQDCAAAAIAAGGIMDLGDYTFLASSPITVSSNFHLRGSGYPLSNSTGGAGSIINNTSSMFTISSTANQVIFENCGLFASAGHIWDASSGPSMGFWKILGVWANQSSASHAIWYQSGGAFIDCIIGDQCFFQCAGSATVSPWTILSSPGNVNSVKFSRLRCLSNGARVPFFNIDPQSAAGWSEEVVFDHITFEITTGGAIRMTGCVDVLIDTCSLWDIPAPRTDTGCATFTSTTVTDSAAVTGDLYKAIAGTGIPSGTTILAVSAGTGYTISQAATATASGLTFTIGGPSANQYSFSTSSASYPSRSVLVRGGRANANTASAGTGWNDFYADSNTTNVLLDSFGSWGTPPVISSPSSQTTIINPTVANSATTPVAQFPEVSIGGSPVSGGDPLLLGFCCCIVDISAANDPETIVVAGYTQFFRIVAGGYSISNLNVYVGTTSSGNIQLGYYSNNSGAPGTLKASTSLAGVGTANTVQTLSLGGSYTPVIGEFLAVSCSDTTAKFLAVASGFSVSTGSKARWYQNAVIPSTASATNGGYSTIHVWGS